MLRTNRLRLPVVSVQGQVCHPQYFSPRGRLSPDGETTWLQGVGGITYNAKIGDCCTDWVADHLEPGVSTRNYDSSQNDAYIGLSCIGNIAEVKSGDAKGARGFVTGKHGGCDDLMVYFDSDTLEKLSIDDKIGIRASGQGLALLDYPDVILRSMSPALLDKMNIKEVDGVLSVPVAKIVPGALMGAGLGDSNSTSGDYDISMFDDALVKQYNLDALRFGDIVAVMDSDTRYGRTYRTGAITIGVVVHSNCAVGGHGPGVTTLMSCKTPIIVPALCSSANLADMFL